MSVAALGGRRDGRRRGPLSADIVGSACAAVGIMILICGYNYPHSWWPKEFVVEVYANTGADLVGASIVILVIDRFDRLRKDDERRHHLVRECGSTDHAVANRALLELTEREWLADGTLARAHLAGANLAQAHLAHADLSTSNLVGASLVGADLGRAKLVSAQLGGADLTGAVLEWADLDGAALGSAKLRRADMAGATLRNANLVYCDLSEADLSFADVSGADLTGADLSGTDL
jgi:uncharacterized protein YjbI with pentapeptide repeats